MQLRVSNPKAQCPWVLGLRQLLHLVQHRSVQGTVNSKLRHRYRSVLHPQVPLGLGLVGLGDEPLAGGARSIHLAAAGLAEDWGLQVGVVQLLSLVAPVAVGHFGYCVSAVGVTLLSGLVAPKVAGHAENDAIPPAKAHLVTQACLAPLRCRPLGLAGD